MERTDITVQSIVYPDVVGRLNQALQAMTFTAQATEEFKGDEFHIKLAKCFVALEELKNELEDEIE